MPNLPNTFGPSGTNFVLIDPKSIIENRRRFNREDIPELKLANSYYSLAGGYPDVGWLLIDRYSYNQIDKYATNLQLTIADFVNDPLVISNLAIVQAKCVTRGIASDTNAVYLVQVTNTQGVLYNPWFQTPVNTQYNVRVPGYPDTFHYWSLNSGSTWTWDTLLEDLWNRAPSQLGTYPHIPITPSNVPENQIFVGVSLWETIGNILSHLGLSVVGSYPNYSIVSMGDSDSTFTSLQGRYVIYLEDDMEYIDGGSGRVPSQVVVYFHRRNQVYGTEETVRRTSEQWQSTPVYSVTVNAPSTFSTAAGAGFLWADYTVRYDENGSPLAADVVQANTIANERVTEYFNTIFRGTQGFMHQRYSGVLPFTTGSLVDGVKWFNYGNDHSRHAGWHTELIRGFIWEEAKFNINLEGFTLR